MKNYKNIPVKVTRSNTFRIDYSDNLIQEGMQILHSEVEQSLRELSGSTDYVDTVKVQIGGWTFTATFDKNKAMRTGL